MRTPASAIQQAQLAPSCPVPTVAREATAHSYEQNERRLAHCTTEREAKCSKLGHICLHTKVPTLIYDVALGALSFDVAF